jgi:hypothetical protein
VQFFLTADGEVQSVHARRRPQRVHANMLKLAGMRKTVILGLRVPCLALRDVT